MALDIVGDHRASHLAETRGRGRVDAAVSLLPLLKLSFIAAHTVVVCPVIVGLALVDERAAYRLCQRWSRINLLVSGVRVRTRRMAALDPARPYVFMSNHRSQFDILAVVTALEDFQLRWVAKKELTRVPVFGWALQNAGHIIIDRSDHAQAVASLRAARAKMQEGVSVVIFPEGTRAAPDQTLLPFKKGGFMLALETGFPIVPVVVRGSAAVLPNRSTHIRSGEIEVVVGAPIPVTGRERDDLMRRVQSFMLEELGPAPGTGRAAAVAEAS
jgi:1-acyl-sn-glycerol-3-phosphate acyltransferase